jgi:hypothetical protein
MGLKHSHTIMLFPLTIYRPKCGLSQDQQLSNSIGTQLGFWPNSPKIWILVKAWWLKPSYMIKWLHPSIYKPKCGSNQDQQLSNSIGTQLGLWTN